MPRAVSIGGRVVDAEGRGVPGVGVGAECDVPANALPGGVRFDHTLAAPGGPPVTDAEGRSRLTNAPAPATEFRLHFRHPDYASDAEHGGIQAANGVTLEQLRAGTALVTLKPGARVRGVVTGPDGKPVAGAVVAFHADPYLTPGDWEVVTDARGGYALPTLAPGRHPIPVFAAGLRTEGLEVALEAGDHAIDFRLAVCKPLVVKVVDEAGKPIPHVAFDIRKRRGGKSLYNHKHSNVTPNGVPLAADAGGVYAWPGAPADAVRYSVSGRGYREQGVELAATGVPQTIVLRATPVVAGRVTDAATGRAVEQFRVTPVIDFGRSLAPARYDGFDGAAGAYRHELRRDDCDYRILTEAPGYRTAMSRAGLLEDKVTAADFQLEPASPVTGRVLGADGKPASGAKVSLANLVESARYPSENNNNLFAVTDADGVYRLPAQASGYALFAEHPAGCARADRERDQPGGDLALAAWASVKGALWQDGKPIADQFVSLSPFASPPAPAPGPRLVADFQTRTDQSGAFRFDRVPAGPASVWPHLGPWKPSPLTSAEIVPLDLRPGQSATLDLGKSGATLRGRLTLAGDPPAGLTFECTLAELVRRAPDFASAAATPGLTREQLLNWTRGDGATPRSAHRAFTLKPASGGEFRAVGVPAGDYWLVARVYEKPEGCLVNPCGVAVAPVSVSASQAAGRESVELPPVAITARRGPRVGEPLPELALRDAAGAPIDLAAFRGRTLLLHGWAGWCSYCPKDYPKLRALRAGVPSGKLAVAGLNLDADAAACARLAAKSSFDWPQAAVGTPAAEPAAARLALGSVPLYLVVDAAGVVRHRGTEWASAEAAARKP